MKPILPLLVSLALVPALLACQRRETITKSSDKPSLSQGDAPTSTTPTSTPTTTATPSATTPPTASDTHVPIPIDPRYATPCDKGRPGPAMVQVTSLTGVAYCIDSTEVTQSQYALFLAQADATKLSLPGRCATVPIVSAPPPWTDTNSISCGSYYNPEKRPNAPMTCLDWCQAHAYCQWAGKRLCGAIGGDATTQDNALNASKDEWYNACSNQGKTKHPYGNEYEAGACYDQARVMSNLDIQPQDFTWGPELLPDVSLQQGCHGQDGPFQYIYDLDGSVSEWVNDSPGTYKGALRGGVAVFGEEASGCQLATDTTPEPNAYVGFRCCAD